MSDAFIESSERANIRWISSHEKLEDIASRSAFSLDALSCPFFRLPPFLVTTRTPLSKVQPDLTWNWGRSSARINPLPSEIHPFQTTLNRQRRASPLNPDPRIARPIDAGSVAHRGCGRASRARGGRGTDLEAHFRKFHGEPAFEILRKLRSEIVGILERRGVTVLQEGEWSKPVPWLRCAEEVFAGSSGAPIRILDAFSDLPDSPRFGNWLSSPIASPELDSNRNRPLGL